VWLGPPVLKWSLSDLVDEGWYARTYETIKKFLALARRELELLSFGQCSVLDWAANDAASVSSQQGMAKGHPDDIGTLAERSAPALHAIMLNAMAMPDEAGVPLMIPLIALAAAMRDVGAEIDPDDLFGKMFFFLQKRPDGDN
jgi:hypothetical protein